MWPKSKPEAILHLALNSAELKQASGARALSVFLDVRTGA
jgi:hypothetical protein